MILCGAISAQCAASPGLLGRLTALKWIVFPIAAASSGCSGPGANLSRGDSAPPLMQSSERVTIVLAAGVDDCLNCSLRGVFVALRAIQRTGGGDLAPEVLVVAVTRSARDTLVFRQMLTKQRVAGRIERVAPQAARRMFDETMLPAMYLIADGRVVQEWKPIANHGIVEIGRNDLVDAAAKHDQL